MKEFWSARIRDAVPYTPGEQPRDRKFIKLNTNECPYPPSTKVLKPFGPQRMRTCGSIRIRSAWTCAGPSPGGRD